LNPGLPSASANAVALANRSAGSFSSAFATAAATLGGTVFRNCVTAATGSAMIFMMICCAEPPRCGGWPASISYSTLASEYTSLRAVISFSAVACSGLM
jgi:ABC-type transporter Mla maintaining outer membrane lipid asymmetry permease subunit MlaE